MTRIAPAHWLLRKVRGFNELRTSHSLRFDLADFTPAIRTKLLILQPTPFCNIQCDYCYLPSRDTKAQMSLSTLRKAVERLLDDGLVEDELSIVWHAGEPLVAARSFYEDAIGLLAELLGDFCTISHSLQTNGTLIDDDWCELFRRHNIRVGVSVDGPAKLHDAHRRTRAGLGTHNRVVRGMQALRRYKIPFRAIAVVTSATLSEPDSFFDFFLDQGAFELGCNFDEVEGVNASSTMTGREGEHAAFLTRLLERTVATNRKEFRVREFETALRLIGTALPTYMWQDHVWPENIQTVPFSVVAIAHDGRFTTFSPELLGQPSPDYNDFVLGNVLTTSYLGSSRQNPFLRIWHEVIQGVQACERTCSYFQFCGGGAPANKLYEHGSLATSETLYCRSMVKRPFEAVLSHLEREHASSLHVKQSM